MRDQVVKWSVVAMAVVTLYACDHDAPAAPEPGGTKVIELPVNSRLTNLPGLHATASRGLSAPEPKAFVSIERGSLSEGTSLVLRRASGGAEIHALLTGGGLDPVAVPALGGEELLLDVMDGSDLVLAASALVIPRVPPIVIRTDPPKRRTSVPVNMRVIIVFSEPIEPTSVTSRSIRLIGAGAEVQGTLVLRDDGTVVELYPSAPLRYSTDYTLEIGTDIVDLSGDHLVEAESVAFQTEPCVSTDTTPFAVRLLPDTLTLPVGTGSGFVVQVDSGARLINQFPDPSLTWASTDSAIARPLNGAVDAVGIGEAYITVEYKGDVDSALVIVTESPPPGPFGIFPGGATLPVGFTLQFAVTHPAGTEPPAVSWSSTNASIFTVDASGTIVALTPGIAELVAAAGEEVDTAEIEVYDPTPPLADLFIVTPHELLLQVGDVRQMAVSGPFWPAPPVIWSAASSTVASIDALGMLRAEGAGTTEIVATFADGSSNTAQVEVVPAGTLGRISLTPAAVTASVGDTIRFTLSYDATAAANYGDENVGWGVISENVQVLRYVAAGVFEVIAAGAAQVSAYVGPLVAEATVTAVP